LAYFISPQVSRPPLQKHEYGLSRPADHVLAALLLMTRMIQKAFEAALETNYRGEPTQDALDAVEYIESRTDWTLTRGAIPPEELRKEFALSFEFCCRWLGYSPQEIRERGLPRAHGNRETGSTFDDSRHVPGLDFVRDYWRRRRAYYEAHWALLEGRECARLEREAKKAARLKENAARKKAERKAATHDVMPVTDNDYGMGSRVTNRGLPTRDLPGGGTHLSAA